MGEKESSLAARWTMNFCPRCKGSELEFVSGDYDTGVVAPDGYCERVWQESFHCLNCDLYFQTDRG